MYRKKYFSTSPGVVELRIAYVEFNIIEYLEVKSKKKF